VPVSVTIRAGSAATFEIAGTSAGTDTLVATAPGYRPDTVSTVVSKGLIYLVDTLYLVPSSVRVQDSVPIYLAPLGPDSAIRPVVAATTFTLTPNARIQFVSGDTASTVITSVTIPADGTGASFWIKGVSPGTGSFTVSHPDYQTVTFSITVSP